VCNRPFGWRGVVDLHLCQNSEGEVGGTGRVARPAADDQATGGVAAACDFADVVGGEVGDCGLNLDTDESSWSHITSLTSTRCVSG
jgi:hypothetical protein